MGLVGWCGYIALELWLEPRLPLHARLSSAVEEFLSASTCVLNKGTSNAHNGLVGVLSEDHHP